MVIAQRRTALVALLTVALFLVVAPERAMGDGIGPAERGDSHRTIGSFFSNYCTKCHGARKRQGKLTLHDIQPLFVAAAELEKWRMIAEQLQFGDMPPEDSPPPASGRRARTGSRADPVGAALVAASGGER